MGEFNRRNFLHTLLKMNITTWLSLLIAVIAFATPAQSSEPRVVCYYTNWSVYRPGTARFNPQNINPYLCTHLIYAFGGFTKDNALKPFDKYQDIEKGGYAKFTGLKTYNKKLKTMLAIGGWNEGSTRFSPMVASRERRKEFVRNAIKFLRQNHFDGLDLDWEYPAFRDGGKPKDRENYAKLVKELREEFEREAEKTGKPRLLLTMAVPAGIEYIQKGFDVQTLNQYLDWMNLLTYDYHSAFEPAVNHHAPLYPLEEPNEYSVDTELNIDYTIKFYLENGADPDKLVLGIPTYGRSYTLFNPDAVEIGSPADGPGEQGDATREKGYLAYYEICEALKPKNKKRSARASEEDSEEASEEEDEEWTVMYPNPKAMGPVAFKGNQWVGYDDIEIVRRKADYVAENRLGGIMFWSIDNDDFRGNCHDKPYPLIEAAKEAYIVRLGATDNSIVTDRPQSVTRASSRRRNRPRSSTTTTTEKPSTAARTKPANRKSSITSTTPTWNVITPEPPTTPDPGSDFKCTDEGFFPHPRDCKKYFWCLDSGPSNLGIVAHQFTCPSGLFFNKAADSCDFARNVLCKKPSATTKAPTTKAPTTKAPTTASPTTTTTRKPVKLSTRNSLLFRTTTTTTTTTPEPEIEEYSEEVPEDATDIEAEDPKVIKELIDLIKKVGGVEQLEKHLHLGEASASTDGAKTTTPSEFNKKLYQKVLERTRSKSKFGGNSVSEVQQNSRRGPQNAGLEPAADKDKLLRKDRPQYTTINRSRPSTPPPEPEENAEDEDEIEVQPQRPSRARAVDPELSVATTAKPLQYVNIRRARPTTLTTSDTADDTASRNALFERSEPYVTVSDSTNSLDIVNARRENIPEYVTIRRQRPTTEEPTTTQYENTVQETESQETVLEREISSQPQYKSIVRARATTEATIDEPSSPEPTTVLAVQISSLLNSPNSDNDEQDTSPTEAEIAETTSTSTTTTTTTVAPSSITSTRRTILRRRGSTTTTTTTSAPSTTQVSSRNYTFVRRRRPLARPNEISPDSDDTDELSRKIRSTTPDSREADGVRNVESRQFRRTRVRIAPQNEDSVPAAASQVDRGQFRPQLSRDEVISLTPIDVETPQFIQRPNTAQRTERRFRPRTLTTVAEKIEDSEVSAATVEVRRPNILPRGRSRFSLSTQTPAGEPPIATESSSVQFNVKRPTFTRFSPRPFARGFSSSATEEPIIENEPVTTSRPQQRVPFSRGRPLAASPLVQARKLPFPSRTPTTQQALTNDDDFEDAVDNKNDDIALSESAVEEKEHEDKLEDEPLVQEIPKRRVVIKKLRPPTSTPESIISTETIPIEESGKKKFRVIRRRPTSTTETPEPVEASSEAPSSASPKVRRIIRKKIKPVETDPQIITKSLGSLNSVQISATTEPVINYGEKTRTTVAPSEVPTTITSEEELLKLEDEIGVNKENVDVKKDEQNKETVVPSKDIESDKIEPEINAAIEVKPTEITSPKSEDEEQPKPDVLLESAQQSLDLSENKEAEPVQPPATETEEPQPETTTSSTTLSTSPSSARARLPYRPPKRLFTSTTESSVPSSSKVFSRKYNPGAYTSPSSVDKPESLRPVTRRPLFTSKIFTRKPFTARTTQKVEEDEYSDEEILDEEPENPFVFVPQNQLFSRNPNGEEDEEEYDEDSGEITDDEAEEEPSNRFTTKKPTFKPRVVNSNTFRASTTTTELPKRSFGANSNRTAIFNRFGSNKPVNDTKKRVQNVPQGYTPPSSTKSSTASEKSETTTVRLNKDGDQITTTDSDFAMDPNDDDYLTMTESTSTLSDTTNTEDETPGYTIDNETTPEMEISTGDYLEFTEGTTNYPSTQDTTANSQTETESNTVLDFKTEQNTEITTESLSQATTNLPPVTPIIKTQFDKLFSVSRIVEVSSKLDKHRLNKNNETTLIEEGKVMIEQKPVVDKIGEVSRFSLIKIFEDEIPLYLTKLGHVYPVENPPDNLIRIDEARNARALNNFADAPRENLVASESVNEAYRHVKNSNQENGTQKDRVEHLLQDDFLSYINDDKKDKSTEEPDSYTPEWQFVPAAFENEKINQNKQAKSYEIVTPKSMRTDPSTLPLEALFKTETPAMARKEGDSKDNQPFVVYSASVPTQNEGSNIVKLQIIKPEAGRSIVTFAKGQEFKGAAVAEQTTAKYPVDMSVIPLPAQSTTEAMITTSSEIETVPTSPIMDLLTTNPVPTTTETQTTTTEEPSTTETVLEETTTQKISPLDAKRSKFAFPRRPIIKPSNFTRPTPRVLKKINATVVSNVNQKANKTTGFNPSKTRFTATRSQNVPVDIRKKPSTKLPRTFSTETPKTTTERKLYFKPIRPAFRPAFVPRKATTTPQTNEET